MLNKSITTKQRKESERVEIKNDCIICYLDGSSFKDEANFSFKASEDGKQVYYIIENVNFIVGLYINAQKNTHIVFKNCSFYVNININSLGEVIFERNRYYATEYPTLIKNFFNCNAENLRFTNEYFINSYKQKHHEDIIFGMNIKTKFLFIDNSLIQINDVDSQINIKSQEAVIFNSIVTCPIINIDSDDIYTCHSSLLATTKMSIENKNNNQFDEVLAPIFIYNGERIKEQKVFEI